MRNGDMKGRNARSALARRLFKGIGSTLAAMLATWAVGSAAATLTINGNRVTLEGDASATITHTSSGIDIEIPGVSIELDCTTQGATTDECVVKIGAGSTASSGGISSGSGGVSSGSGDGSTGSGSGDINSGSGDVPSGSGDDSTGSGSGGINSDSGGVASDSGGNNPGSDDADVSAGSGDTSADDSKSIGSGSSGVNTDSSNCATSGSTITFGNAQCDWGSDEPGDSGDPDADTDDDQNDSDNPGSPSGTIGGNRDTSGGSTIGSTGGNSSIGSGDRTVTSGDGSGSGASSSEPFPAYDGGNCGGARVYCSGIEVGPDANQTAEVQIYKGMVTVTDITVSAGSAEGSIQWVPNATYARGSGALRVWLSDKPDGDRLDGTERCGFVTGFENRIFVSQTGSGCVLSPNGGQYYLNFAICESNEKDYSCKAPEARASTSDYAVYVKSSL